MDNPLRRYAFSSVRVTVEDVNDNSPVMQQHLYQAEIVENLPNGSPVTRIRATDVDEVQGYSRTERKKIKQN